MVSCENCQNAFHKTCSRKILKLHRNVFYCKQCLSSFDLMKYNPYYELLEENKDHDDTKFNHNEPIELMEIIEEYSSILENCKNFTISQYNETVSRKMDSIKNLLTINFLNIDGNTTSFDCLATTLQTFKNKSSVIGIAETNTSDSNDNLYTLDGYSSIYMKKIESKKKGSGVAMYIRDGIPYVRTDELSTVNKDIEILFAKSLLKETSIFVGVLYCPPNGDLHNFNDQFLDIISKFKKSDRICILGDYNINLFEESVPMKKFEENFRCTGFLPTISIATHHKPNCLKNCIDNILIKNLDTDSLYTGTITTHISHHNTLFAIINANSKLEDNIAVTPKKITHCYSDENIASLNALLQSELRDVPHDFETFLNILNDCIDRTCKLQKPKTSVRTKDKNPWITRGLINAISKRDYLYEKWRKSTTKRCKSGNPMLRAQFRKYRNMLANLIKLGKQTYYRKKFDNVNGDQRKMWTLINNLRGKSTSKLPSTFTLGKRTVACKSDITRSFNEHFCSLAGNLNKKYP